MSRTLRTRFVGTAAILLAVLALGEVAARRALPRVPSCVEVTRNPFRFRGWPEYVREMDAGTNVATLLLLSNSQAYAGEYPEHKTYPAILEGLLNERHPGGIARWKVLNWATDGMTSIEQMWLAARAREHPPTVVLAVTGYADYAAEHAREGFLYCRSDVPRLCRRPALAASLPLSYWWRHGKVEDVLTCLLRDASALARCREYAWSWLETRFPGIHGVLYAPRVHYLPWAMKLRPRTPPLRRDKSQAGDPVLTYQGESDAMLREYLSVLARIDARVIAISQPCRVPREDDRFRWVVAFGDDLKRLARERGLTCWDLHESLPYDEFVDQSHFRSGNHRRFAEMLADRLEEEMAGEPEIGIPSP